MKSIRENILRYGTIVTLALLPLLFWSGRVSPHMSSKSYFLYGSTVILGVLWLYSFFTDASWQPTRKQAYWLAIPKLFVTWFTIAGLCAANVHLAFWSSFGRETGLLTWYSALFLMYITVSLVNKYGRPWLYQMLGWYLASGIVVGLSLWFGNEGFNIPIVALQKGSGGGLIGNSSLAAAYAFFIFCAGLVVVLAKDAPRYWKVVAWISGIVMITSPIFCNMLNTVPGRWGFLGQSRGATLGLIVAFVLSFVFWLVFSPRKVARSAGIIFGVAIVMIFAFSWSALMNPTTVLHDKFASAASKTRFVFWQKGQQAMDERPILGYGPENYMIAFQHYFDPRMLTPEFNNEAWNDRAHNIYFDTGAQAGYPGIVLYFSFIVAVLVLAGVLVKKGQLSDWQGAIVIALVLGYTFQNLFVFDSMVTIVGLFLLYGWMVGLYGHEKREKGLLPILHDETGKYALAGILAVSGLIGWYFLAYAPARQSAAYGEVFSAPIDIRSARYVDLLSGPRIGQDWDLSGMAHDIFKLYATNPMAIKSNKQLLPYAIKDIQSLIALLEAVAPQVPTDYRLNLKIVHLYTTLVFLNDTPMNKQLADHILIYANAGQKLAPTDPEIYWAIGQVDAWAGDLPGAQAAYEKSVAVDPQVAVSWNVLLSFYQAAHDQKNYQNTLVQAQKAIPGFVAQ